MAVNDDLADDAILRTVRAMRATNGIWKELLPILRRVERDLIEIIADGAPRTIASRRARRLLQEVRTLIEGGVELFLQRLEGRGIELASIEARATINSFDRNIPIAVEWVRPSATLLQAVAVAEPFQGALLRDHLDKWSADTIFSMQAEIRTSIIEGEGIEPMQRRIRRVAEIKTRDARSIARTYTAHVTNAARAKVYQENSDVIAKEQWVATLDDRTCIRCAALDNETFPVGKGTQAPLHLNCRCVRVPITKAQEALQRLGFEIAGTRTARGESGLTGEVPANMAFPEWLKRQPERIQREVLGAKRFELFRSGTTIDKFVNDENEIIPLEKLLGGQD